MLSVNIGQNLGMARSAAFPRKRRSCIKKTTRITQTQTSLLRRLAGAGRVKREEGREAQLPKHSGSRNGAGGNEEQVDLPVFFGRGKR